MARQFDAHVIGLYVLPAAEVYSEVGMLATPILFEGYRDLFKSKLEEVRKKFEARVKQDGLKAEWRVIDSSYPDIAESAITHSRGAELVITSQIERGPDGDIERDLVVRLIMESGRPVWSFQGPFVSIGEGIAKGYCGMSEHGKFWAMLMRFLCCGIRKLGLSGLIQLKAEAGRSG
jgi:hypothetical protein